MATLKYPYEISVWTEHLNDEGIKVEKKELIIGANDMTYLGKATSVKLRREIKGTHTLSFQMPSKFFNSATGEYEHNDYVDYLYNQRIVKLFYKNKWLEFNVHQVTEEKQFKSIMYSYECTDSFIDELSRTGYDIVFDEELNNNVDEIGNFMEITLEDSIWDYRPDFNSGDFTEYTEEKFYKIPLRQFNGALKAYKINLKVNIIDNNYWGYQRDEQGNIIKDEEEKPKFKPWVDKDGKREILKNIHTGKTRQLEYGDDLSREQRVFWDNYEGEGNSQRDNGDSLFNEDNAELLDGDYIYIPYSDLTYIYGNLFEEAYKSTATPAIYGTYENNKGIYALQPKSDNPYGLIQILYFKDDDKIVIDDSGTIMNNDCHYIMRIKDWNDSLKESPVFWSLKLDDYNEDTDKIINESAYGTLKKDGNTYYINVKPSDNLTDDFNWNPVYYEGYLNHIGDQDVYMARKLSITDRTELNLNLDKYTKVYQNKSSEYKGLYSEKYFNSNPNGYRVNSSEETRIILPTLAKNKISNGTKISSETSWEQCKQITEDKESDTGSYLELMEITSQSMNTNNLNIDSIDDSLDKATDESINDFYLSIKSPYLTNCKNFEKIGTVSSDIALNFGFSANQEKIEKDKVYAIRICTLSKDDNGNIIKNYNTDISRIIIGEGSYELNGNYSVSGGNGDCGYVSTEVDKKFNIEMSTDEDENIIEKDITTVKETISYNYSPDDNDYEHHIDFLDLAKEQDSIVTTITDTTISDKDGNVSSQNSSTTYEYNSNDIVYNTDKNGNRISYIPSDLDGNLTETLYHNFNKNSQLWSWSTKQGETYVPDNGFILFKAPMTIENPYIGIRVNSSPAKIDIQSCKVTTYKINNGKGVIISIKDKNDNCIDGASIGIDKVCVAGSSSFTDTYSQRVVDFARYVLGMSDEKPTGDYSYINENLYKSEDRKVNKFFYTTTSSSTNPLYFSAVEFEGDNDYTYPYALYIGDGTNYYFKGFFNFELKTSASKDEATEGGEK